MPTRVIHVPNGARADICLQPKFMSLGMIHGGRALRSSYAFLTMSRASVGPHDLIVTILAVWKWSLTKKEKKKKERNQTPL